MTRLTCFACLVLILTVTTSTLADGERPGLPFVTIKKVRATSIDIEAKLSTPTFKKVEYSKCEGHVALLKESNDQKASLMMHAITERDGGFRIEDLKPNTEYLIKVACKTKGVAPNVHVGDFTEERVFRTSELGEDHDDDLSDENEEQQDKTVPMELPEPLRLMQSVNDNNSTKDESSLLDQVFGVIGEFSRLHCEYPSSDDEIQFIWTFKDKTLENSREFKISNNGNSSELRVFLKTKARFGHYQCRVRLNETVTNVIRSFQLLEAKMPPKFKLIPELVEMTSAKFRTEFVDPLAYDEVQFLIGHVVFYKRKCHLMGAWLEANITEEPNGFTLLDLRPHESYYMKVALRNKATVGDFDQYWTIHTSGACALKAAGTKNSPQSFSFFIGLGFIIFITIAQDILFY